MLTNGGLGVQRSIQTAELTVAGSSTGKNKEGRGPRSKREFAEGRKIGFEFGRRRRRGKRYEREGFMERETMVHSTGMLKLCNENGRR